MDELPQFRAGCRPVQLLVYDRISFRPVLTQPGSRQGPGKCNTSHSGTGVPEEFGFGQLWVGVQTSCHCLCFYFSAVWVSCRGLCPVVLQLCKSQPWSVYSLCCDWTQQKSMECKGRKKGGRCWREEDMGLHRGVTLAFFKEPPTKHNNKLNRQKTKRQSSLLIWITNPSINA